MTPKTGVDIIGSRTTAPIQVIVDTGFDGDVCLPVSLAVRLGLELIGQTIVEYADGTEKMEFLFAASARLLGHVRKVYANLTNGEDALIGTNLLKGHRLSIDFDDETVQIARKSRKHT